MLSSGERLGRYEIVSPLGAGGMGEVYRARDTELQRDVALKIVAGDLSSDPERVKRFEREARATAALSHPNLLTVFDVGHAGERAYLVFEMLEGSTLAEVMLGGRLPVRQVLDHAGQVASGLALAHARGIVHRDIKPANLFLTTAGVVKVLDFGLARIRPSAFRASDDDATSELTGPGLMLGTVSYMSPEQAQGEPVDERSDIFSLGTVLYEMLSGRHPFRRRSATDTVTAILRDPPADLGPLEGNAPEAVKQLVRRCLEKRPEDRFQSAHDLALALEAVGRTEGRTGTPLVARASSSPVLRRWGASAFLLVFALVLSATAWQRWRSRGADHPPARLVALTSLPGSEVYPAFSPDADQVAFTWGGDKSDNQDIYIKMVGSSELRRLTTDPAADTKPSWSPDGRQIAFVRSSVDGARAVHLVSPLGGPERRLSDQNVSRVSWSPDGRWLACGPSSPSDDVASGQRGVRLIGVPGAETITVTSPRAPTYHTNATFSPDGRAIAYASCVFPACHLEIVALRPDRAPNGAPRRVTRTVVGIPTLAWTRDGRSLIYASGQPFRLWRVGLEGEERPEAIEIAGYGAYAPAIAGSGARLAFQRDMSETDVYRLEPGRSGDAVASSTLVDVNPQYSPDGRRFAFESARDGEARQIWLAAADGSNPTQLTRGPGLSQGSPRWSPDGRRIAFDSLAEDGTWDIWTIDADGGALRRLTQDAADENVPSWSRDGRFVYFTSNRTGGYSVWRIAAHGGREERLTRRGGTAFEAVDGQTLFFTRELSAPSPLLAVPLAGGPERTVVACVRPGGFAVGRGGIYYQGCGADRRSVPVYLHSLSTGRERLVGTQANWAPGLTVSPDERSILYSAVVSEGSDLVLIEHFH